MSDNAKKWLTDYARVERDFARARKKAEKQGAVDPPNDDLWEHDDALADLAHRAASIFEESNAATKDGDALPANLMDLVKEARR